MAGLRPIAVVTALCLALWALPAWASPPVMVWPGGPEAPVAEAEALLRAQGVEVISRAALHEAIEEHRARRAARDEARHRGVEAALAAAQEHYLSLEIAEMIAALRGAEADAAVAARPGRCDGLWELEFRLGLGLGLSGAEGDREDARARYELALALDPERRPLAELYGPDVTAAFLAAVEGRSAALPRSVPVRVQPADARVELDCRPHAGAAADLRPGLHAVRVDAPGHAAWAGVVDLRERDAVEVTLTALPDDDDPAHRLAMSTEGDPQPDGSSSARAAVWAAAHGRGAAAVLVVGSGEGGRHRARPWGRDGIGSAVERRDLDAALRAVMGLLDDDGRLVAPAPVVEGSPGGDGKRPPPGRKPVLRTWWFWTIVGTVVLTGTAVGLGLGLRPQDPAAPAPGQLIVVAK